MGDTTTNYKITATYQEALSAFERINAEIGEGSQTIAGMTDKAAKLNKEFKQTRVGSEAFEFLGQQTKKANAELSAMVGTTARFNMVGINTARLFSDMGYFATSASMGIMAIGNNISPLVESFQQAKLNGDSFGKTLMNAFSGMGGWLIGINILVSAITAYSIASAKAKQSTDSWDLKSLIGDVNGFANAIKKIRKELEGLTDAKLGEALGKINKEISEQNRLLTIYSSLAQSGALGAALFGGSIEGVVEQLIKLNAAQAEANKVVVKPKEGSLTFLQEQLKSLNELFEQGDTSVGGSIIKLQAKIDAIEKLRRQGKKEKPEQINNEFEESRAKAAEKYWNEFYDDLDKLEQKQKEDRKKYDTEIEDFRIGAIEDTFRREEGLARLRTDRLIALDKERLDRDSINQDQHNAYILLLEQQFQRQKSDIQDKEEKKKTDDENKKVQNIVQSYNKIFNSASKIGNLLERSFDKAGTGFISQLNEALQIVIQIADIMEMTGLLKMIIGGAATVASAGAVPAVAGVIPGFLPIPRMQQAPTIVNVQLGTATVARVVARGNQLAQELRY